MKPASFTHYEPSTVDEAVALLEDLDDPTILAGGQSLVPLMRFRLSEPEDVIDINGIDDLDYLTETDGVLRIGALARHADLEDSPLIDETTYGAFADTAPEVADPLVRNRGTVAGSVAHADPAGDWGAVLIAHEGEVIATGPGGERSIPADEFFDLPFSTALAAEELVTELRIPAADPREGSAYHKLKRKVGDFAAVGVAARVVLADDGTLEDAGIGLAAVDVANVPAPNAAATLIGERPSPDRFAAAGAAASEECNPSTDQHGSEAYKRSMVDRLTQRALADAVERTGLATVTRTEVA